MRATFPAINEAAGAISRSLLDSLPVPVPFDRYPNVDPNVLKLLHCALRLREVAETLTDTSAIRHIIQNTPGEYAANLIDFGLRSAPAPMQKFWENLIHDSFPVDLEAARSHDADGRRSLAAFVQQRAATATTDGFG